MNKKILKSTNQGVLTIGDQKLACAVLEDGTRVISRNAIFRAFGRTKRGRAKDEIRVLNLPSFIDAKNLQPFINNELQGELIPMEYLPVKGTQPVTGYNALILPKICDVYLDARNAKKLTKSQQRLAIASEMLVRSFSKVGIIALVDEATGYQAKRDRDDLQRFLALYLSEERLKWAKMFPDEYYKQLFRLHGWTYSPMSVKRPKCVGKLTNELVYEKLPAKVLPELKRLNPVKNKKTGRREATHAQHLSADIGQPDLRDHLLQLIAVMRVSPNLSVFKRNFARAFPSAEGEQLQLINTGDEED